MKGVAAACAIVLVTVVAAPAQRPVFRAQADVVSIDVSVMDGKKPVTSLTINDFGLTDDGVPQTLLDVGREPMPLDITLTVDISGSVTPDKRATIERAVRQVSETLRPDDRCSVVSFGLRILEESPLRQPPLSFTLTNRALNGTSLIDALLLSMVSAPTVGRRQLNLVLTDAGDTTSFFDPGRVYDTLRYASGQTSVIVVGTGKKIGDTIPAHALINNITATTGGQVVMLNRDDALTSAFLAALEEFRTSYLLRYAPTGVSREDWHPVVVTVAGQSRYVVRARKGYWFTTKAPARPR